MKLSTLRTNTLLDFESRIRPKFGSSGAEKRHEELRGEFMCNLRQGAAYANIVAATHEDINDDRPTVEAFYDFHVVMTDTRSNGKAAKLVDATYVKAGIGGIWALWKIGLTTPMSLQNYLAEHNENLEQIFAELGF